LALDEGKASPESWDISNPLFIVAGSYPMLRFLEDASHPSNSAHRKDVTISYADDEKTQLLSQGLTLLLAARERVLTLSEQRVGPSSLSTYYHLFVSLAPQPSDSPVDVTFCDNLH
jgi:hypothetical protein